MSPRSAEEWDTLVDAAVARSDYRKAIELCDGALEEHPDLLAFLCNRGLYQQEAGLLKEAEATFRKVLDEDPTHSEAQQNYSNLLLDEKRNQEAETRLREWVHQAPDVANLLFNLSVAALRRGNKQEALEALGEVLRLDSTFVEEARKEYVALLGDRDFKAVLAAKAKDRPRNPFPWYLPSHYTTRPAPIDVGKRYPDLKSKSAIRLHPRARGPLPQGASKLGGVFLLNGKAAWPICKQHGTACTAVLQLRAADVPQFPFPKGKDLFQLMWCARDHESENAPKIEVRWLSMKNIGRSAAANPPAKGAEKHYVPNECALFPEHVTDYPDRWELGKLEARFKADSELKKLAATMGAGDGAVAYQTILSAANGTKLGGYADWVQDPEYPRCPACKKEMEHYLTIASEEWDGMSFHRWKPVEEGIPDRATGGHIDDHGLMIGDAGNLYVFVCREHDDWPVAQVMQCS